MTLVLGTLALVGVALLLGATWYEAVVMAPHYERDIPRSIELARQFLQRTTPAHFFRAVAPSAQLLTLLALVTDWGSAGCWAFALALGVLIAGDIITYTFHYPRLAIMFKSTESQEPGRLARAARQWTIGNWVRGVMLLVALLALLHGLLRVGSPAAI